MAIGHWIAVLGILVKANADGTSYDDDGTLYDDDTQITPDTPPAPPLMPAPPSPPGRCNDECIHASDGTCDDWSNGDCKLGSDCTDCGARIFHSCASTCFALQHHDGECNDGCNVVACGYDSGDCSTDAILSKCVASTDDAMAKAPLGHGGGKFVAQVTMTDLSIISDDVSGVTHAEAILTTLTRWSDVRLADPALNPCGRVDVMHNLVSSSLYAELAMKRFWMPRLLVDAKSVQEPSTILRRDFRTGISGSTDLSEVWWADGQGGAVEATTNFTELLAIESQVYVQQPEVDMFYYPFDEQDLTFRLRAPGNAELLNCETAVRVGKDALTKGSDWVLDRTWAEEQLEGATAMGSTQGVGISILSRLDALDVGKRSGSGRNASWQELNTPAGVGTAAAERVGKTCVIHVKIHRQPAGFLISNVIPTFLVVVRAAVHRLCPSLRVRVAVQCPRMLEIHVPSRLICTQFAGLGGLWLDPTVPPLLGGRVSLLIVSMLVVVNMGRSVRLRLPTTMWKE